VDHYISEVGRGKSCLDANFGVNMKHVLKVVDTGKLDIAFASQLCNALGEDSGVKANATKELILDRKCQQEAKKAAFPGLKKMHRRRYNYDKHRNFISLVVFENSFSSGVGISYDAAQLKKMMAKNQFQVEPATVAVFGVQNAAKVVSVDAKAEREAKLEMTREMVPKDSLMRNI
jgi:hypothetical protein